MSVALHAGMQTLLSCLVLSLVLAVGSAAAADEVPPDPPSLLPARPSASPLPIEPVTSAVPPPAPPLYVPSRDDARVMTRGGAAMVSIGLISTAIGAILAVYAADGSQAYQQHHMQAEADCKKQMEFLCGLSVALDIDVADPIYSITGYTLVGLGLASTVAGIPLVAVGYSRSQRPVRVQPGLVPVSGGAVPGPAPGLTLAVDF